MDEEGNRKPAPDVIQMQSACMIVVQSTHCWERAVHVVVKVVTHGYLHQDDATLLFRQRLLHHFHQLGADVAMELLSRDPKRPSQRPVSV